MRLTVVGASGTFPGPASGCSSYLVEHEGFRLMLDIGNGSIGALQAAAGLFAPDALIVSHLHGDHYLDLIPYTYARRYHPAGAAPPLSVHGPSRIREAITGAFSRDVDELINQTYDITAVDHDQTLSIGPFEVELRSVNHTIETYGMRVSAGGRTLAYSADSAACDALIDLARDVDLFLCEASYLDGEDNPPDVHLTGREAAEHAVRAGAHRLVLTHLVPWGDEARTLAEATRSYDGEVRVARPFDSYNI